MFILDDTNLGFNPIPKIYRNYSPTLRASRYGLKKVDDLGNVELLTPGDCFRLTGFSRNDYKKCKEGGISNHQLYKQAGNSIVVNVLEAIFTSLGEKYNEFSSVAQ